MVYGGSKLFCGQRPVGTWKLNEGKSKLASRDGQEYQLDLTYTEQKDKMKVTVEGVDKDGKPTKAVWVGKVDGKAYKTKGNLAWDSAAYKMVNDRTMDITTMKDGKMVWSGKTTISADGKTRTVTFTPGPAQTERSSKPRAFTTRDK